MTTNDEIRRNLNGMPTGEYRMDELQFRVRTIQPWEKLLEEMRESGCVQVSEGGTID
jgi:hypothetical protein